MLGHELLSPQELSSHYQPLYVAAALPLPLPLPLSLDLLLPVFSTTLS